MRIAFGRPKRHLRVGWVASGTLHGTMSSFRTIPRLFPAMRINNNALWMNRHSNRVRNEIYRPGRAYDVVVFVKAMDERCQSEAAAIQSRGGKVVFDANVNYYEVWGEYDIDGTRPTPEQQRDATAMTAAADWVVADSTRLLQVVETITERASWIPDNVDTRLFRPPRRSPANPRLRLIWSGVSKKARPLLTISEALAALPNAELVLVTDNVPDVLPDLERVLPCLLVPYSERRLAGELRKADVIVSPKRLVNAYELCHTEYKITVGMASGLPAVASPQQSYVEAIGHGGGGTICESVSEWVEALRAFEDPDARREAGLCARRTVDELYTTPITAAMYEELLCELA